MRLRTIALAYAITSSALGSTFVGFSQCGGFVWHWQALYLHTLACCIVLGIVVREPRPQYSVRAIVAIGLILGIVRCGLSVGLSIYLCRHRRTSRPLPARSPGSMRPSAA